MGNISTITYDGEVLAETEEEGAVAVIYDGNTIANLDNGDTKTFYCANTIPKTNIQIGSKTIFCAVKKMIADIIVAVKSSFVAEPSAYTLIGKYTSSQTWTAPETGWFQIEVFGASGKGGSPHKYHNTTKDPFVVTVMSAGGGGGGGYSCSRVKMNEGDTIQIVRGAVGATSSATINSSVETYETMQVTSGGNGGAPSTINTAPSVGAGGVASGGNYSNQNGGAGTYQKRSVTVSYDEGKSWSISAIGYGGSAGYTGGNAGGNGEGYVKKANQYGDEVAATAGKAGFINIYRGDTNVVA